MEAVANNNTSSSPEIPVLETPESSIENYISKIQELNKIVEELTDVARMSANEITKSALKRAEMENENRKLLSELSQSRESMNKLLSKIEKLENLQYGWPGTNDEDDEDDNLAKGDQN